MLFENCVHLKWVIKANKPYEWIQITVPLKKDNFAFKETDIKQKEVL